MVIEEPLEIWLSNPTSRAPALLFTTMRTPGDDLNLVRGWLISSGALQDQNKIASITHTGTGRLKFEATNRVQVNLLAGAHVDLAAYQRIETMNSACGVCGQQTIEDLLDKLPQDQTVGIDPLPMRFISSLIQQLRAQQAVFSQTGGCHGVALFDQHQVLDVREDIGRHNALDKLIGANVSLLLDNNQQPQSALGLVLSSRASYELVQKAAMVKVRFIIAMGAPSSLAIDLAHECDICLLGFVKSIQSSLAFNIYSHPQMLV